MNGPDVLDPGGLVRCDAEEIAPPDATVLLLLGDLPRGRVGLNFELQPIELGRLGGPHDLCKSAVPDGGAAILEEPGNRDAMRGGKGQALLQGA
jgi:hypothetical protein